LVVVCLRSTIPPKNIDKKSKKFLLLPKTATEDKIRLPSSQKQLTKEKPGLRKMQQGFCFNRV